MIGALLNSYSKDRAGDDSDDFLHDACVIPWTERNRKMEEYPSLDLTCKSLSPHR